MPITYTGRSVKPNATTYPSLVDIAVGMSRQPRFAGQGRRWYSVLDHSLFADELVRSATTFDGLALIGTSWHNADRMRLAVLLHDAHEAITGDVPTTFKGMELKYEQDKLDVNIGNAFYPTSTEHPSLSHPDVKNAVKWIDRRALAAEARVVGPPVAAERILDAFGVTEDTPADMEVLNRLLWAQEAWFGLPPFAMSPQDQHPGVKEYLRRVLELL